MSKTMGLALPSPVSPKKLIPDFTCNSMRLILTGIYKSHPGLNTELSKQLVYSGPFSWCPLRSCGKMPSPQPSKFPSNS